MKQHHKTLVAVLVLGAGAGVFGMTLLRATVVPPQEQEAEPPARQASAAVSADAPVRLRIPSLRIDAAVQQVGVGKSGNMAVPSNYTDVAWYKYGTTPGFVGSAVIDGHVDNGLALAGVFKHLNEIKPGDDIFIETKGGSLLHFVVEEQTTYDYKSVPLEEVFNRADKARLNLVTCDGAWVAGEKTYDRRLVVYAALRS